MENGIWIGTSGWTYPDWRGDFYPHDLAQKNWLRRYGEQFRTTEINGSFYRTPSLDAVRNWRDQTPAEFVFAWKASKFITHWKRFSEKCRNSLTIMETRHKALGPKARPVLFQLPPQFKADRDRLVGFIKLLRKKRRYAFEFRDASCFEPAILDVPRDHEPRTSLGDGYAPPISSVIDSPRRWNMNDS
jgi:uncharacterized protein YecE (DUF72 family)